MTKREERIINVIEKLIENKLKLIKIYTQKPLDNINIEKWHSQISSLFMVSDMLKSDECLQEFEQIYNK